MENGRHYFDLDDVENTSGMGKYAHVPPEVSNKFNFGAFFLNVFWLFYYKNFLFGLIFLIFVVCLVIPKTRALSFIIIIILSFIAGKFGNAWAWKARRYKSVSDFHSTHKRLVILGLIVTTIFAPITIRSLPSDFGALLNFNPSSFYSSIKSGDMKSVNPLYELEKLNTQTKSKAYKVRFQKAISTLNSILSNKGTIGDIPSSLTSESLVNIFKGSLMGVTYYDKKVIKTSNGVVYQFVGSGGNCSNNDCYVLIDINGVDKGPNKYWSGDNEAYDRARLFIRRTDKDILYVETPGFIMR